MVCVVHPTFQAACLALGLLEDDNEWVQCLEEAAVMQTGFQLCPLFATILEFCHPSSPLDLWDQFKVHICDDLEHLIRQKFHIPNPTPDQVHDYGLHLLFRLSDCPIFHPCLKLKAIGRLWKITTS
jgi:hypothetical protein